MGAFGTMKQVVKPFVFARHLLTEILLNKYLKPFIAQHLGGIEDTLEPKGMSLNLHGNFSCFIHQVEQELANSIIFYSLLQHTCTQCERYMQCASCAALKTRTQRIYPEVGSMFRARDPITSSFWFRQFNFQICPSTWLLHQNHFDSSLMEVIFIVFAFSLALLVFFLHSLNRLLQWSWVPNLLI